MVRCGRRAAIAACAVALLSACAGLRSPSIEPAPVALDPAFEASGRMSARRGNDGVAVHFTWRHAPAQDQFDVATPLGQVVARMQRDAAGVRVERPGEPVAEYASWSTLTEAVLGVAIPVEGLVAWIQGAATPGVAADIERDAAGRPGVLREQGWEIVYAYADSVTRRPARLSMRYPGSEPIEVRIVVDRWMTPS